MKTHRFFQRSRFGRGIVWFMTLQVMLLQCIPAFALPSGEQVTHGSATFVRDGNLLTINQATSQAIVNYGAFDIGVLETVQFAQPGASASILNRVVGGSGSQIAGSLLANGNVYLINPNGILFSSSARVNVGGLVASALPMSDSDFLAGRLFFSGAGGAVINEGSLAANYIYLIGNQVENRGSISASDVVLAAGQNSVLIDRAAGGEIRLVIDGEDEAEPIEDGEELAEATEDDPVEETAAEEVAADTEVETTEEVADATVEDDAVPTEEDTSTQVLVAVAEEETTSETILEQLVDLLTAESDSGAEQAPAAVQIETTVSVEETVAVVTESDALAVESLMNDPILSDWDAGTVINEGTIDASGVEGGTITLAGDMVGQLGELNADGEDGSGGTITIQAKDTAVLGDDSVTTANAGRNGDGGDIIVFGERTVRVASSATIEAKGGSESGDGGFVETSGLESFEIGTSPDVSAENGEGGTWLIDPYNIEVVVGATTNINTTSPFESTNVSSMLDVGLITTALGLGDVTIQTGAGGAEDGDITFTADLDYNGTGANLLSLFAHDDVIFNGMIFDGTAGGGDALSLDVTADSDGSGAGSIEVNNSIDTSGGSFTATGSNFVVGALGSISTDAGGITVTADDLIDIGGDLTTGDGDINLEAGSTIQQTAGTVSATNLGSIVYNVSTGSALSVISMLGGAMETDQGNITLNSGGLVSLQDVNSVGGGDISVNSGLGTTFAQDVSTAGGALNVAAAGAISMQAIDTGIGTVMLDAGGTLDVAGTVDTLGAGVTAVAGGTIIFSDAVNTHGGTLSASSTGGNVNFEMAISTGGGDILADATVGDVNLRDDVNTGGGDVDAAAGGSVIFNSLGGGAMLTTSNGSVTVVAGANATFHEDVDTDGGVVDVSATNDVVFMRALDTGTGSVAVVAGNDVLFNTVSGGLTTLSGAVDVDAGNDVMFMNMVNTGGGSLTADAGQDISISGSIDTAGGVIDFDAANNIVVAQSVDSGAGTITMDAGSLLQVQNMISSSNVGVSLAGGTVNFVGGGAVQTEGGSLSVTSTTAAVTLLAVDTASGAINVDSAAAINLNGIVDSGGGTVDLAADTDIDINGLLSTGGGDITAAASNNVSVFSAVDSAGGAIDLNAAEDVNITAIGSIDSGGNTVALTSDTDGNGSGLIDIDGAVATAGGDFIARGEDFDNDSAGGAIDTGTGSTNGVGGAIDIAMNNDAVIGDLTTGAPGVSGGSISVTATVGNVEFRNAVNTLGGALTVSAGNTVDFSGDVDTSGGDADITSGADLVLGVNLDAGTGDIALESTAGNIQQTAGVLTGDGLALRSQGNIAVDTDVNTVAAISSSGLSIDITDANSLTVGTVDGLAGVTASNGTSSIRITAGDDLDIQNDITTPNEVALTSGGQITSAGGIVDADALALRAVDGMDVETAVGTVAAYNSTTGPIAIDNTGALTVGTVDALVGAVNDAGGGVNITASGPLTIDNVVADTAGGDIVLTASGATAADDLTINADITATGGNGDIILTAGDSIEQNGPTVSAVNLGEIVYNASTGTTSGTLIVPSGFIQTDQGDITLTAQDTVFLQFVTTGGGTVAATSALDSVTFSQDVMTSGGDLLVDAATSITLDGFDLQGGDADLDAGTYILAQLAVDTGGGDLDATAGSSIDFSSTVDTLGGDLTAATSSGFGVDFHDAVDTSGGNVAVTNTATSVSFNGLATGIGTVRAVAGTDIIMNGPVMTANASVTLDAGALVDVNAAVNTGGGDFLATGGAFDNAGGAIDAAGGHIRVHTTSGDIDIGASVQTTAGSISLLAGNDLNVGANISTTAGTLDLEAAAGSIDMANGTVASTGGGNILAVAGTDVTLGGLNAGAGNVQVRAGGNILDGGDTDDDVTATAASFVAGDGVGQPGTVNLLDIDVTDVAAQAGSGGIYLQDTAGGVDIDSVASFNVNRVGMDGMIAAEASQAVTGHTTTAGGTIVQEAQAGALNVNVAVDADTTGNVLLQTVTSGDVNLNASVDSGSGHISVLADDNINQNLGGDIATGGGTIEVEAGMSGAGVIVMSDGVTSTSGGGNIDYLAPDDITLGGIDAGAGNVAVTSTSGSILDGGDADVDITATAAAFSAAVEVGDVSAMDSIETAVDTIAASAANGISLEDTDAVTVGSVASFNVNRVRIDGGVNNSFTTALAGHTTTAGDIVQKTANGELTVDVLVDAGGANDILLQTQTGGDISLNANVQSGGGNITLLAADAVNQNVGGNVATIAAGTIDVEALNGSITMADTTAATTAGGNVRYAATSDVTVGSLNAGAGNVSIVAGGNILDGGDAARDVIATTTRLEAGGTIGETSDKLDTQVSTLAAAAGTGVYLDNLGAVAVDDVGPISVNRVGMDGMIASTPTDAAMSDLTTTTDGNIVLTANDTITINDGTVTADGLGVNANGAGNVLLMTMGGGDVTLNAGVQSGTGSISLLGADNVILATADADVTTGDGSIDIEAGATIDFQDADATLTSGNGNINLQANTDLTITGIDAGMGTVTVTSVTGSILDGGDTVADITAGAAGLSAAVAVGDLPTMNSIDTEVDTLAATAGAGGISLTDADAVTIGEVSGSGVNRVLMDGSTSNLTASISATGLVTSAGGSIVAKTTVDDLTVDAMVDADGAGNILLQTPDGVVLNAAVESDTGSIKVSGLLGVQQNADGDIQTGGMGTIFVQSNGGAITMEDGATTTSGGGSIRIESEGDLLVGGVDAGSGDVVLNSVFGSILDNGNSDTDVSANDVLLSAVNSVGSSTNKLDLSVNNIAVLASTGIFLANDKAISVTDSFDGAIINDVLMDGSFSALAPAVGASDLFTFSGDIVLVADGTITLEDGTLVPDGIAVSANGGGNVLLMTSAGDIVGNAATRSDSGNISLNAANDVTLAVAGDVMTTGAGTIDVLAGNAVTMADGTDATTGSGNIRVEGTAGDVTLGGLATGGDVAVQAGGAILDGGDASTDVAAANAVLTAGTTVGTTANKIDTEVGVLAAQAGTGIFVEELATGGDLEIGSVNFAGIQRVAMDGTAALAGDQSDTGLETTSDGSIVASAAGGALTVNQAIAANGTGNVLLMTAGGNPMNVNADVTSGTGNIHLNGASDVNQTAAIGTGGAGTILVNGANLNMTDAASATTAGGDISYDSSSSVSVGSLDAGSGSVSVTAVLGINDAGETATDIIASEAYLEVTGGDIGSTTDQLDLQVSTLAASTSGDMFLQNTGAVAIDTVTSIDVNTVGMDGASTAVSTGPFSDLTGNDIVLVSDNTITVNDGIDADGIGVDATTTGNVLLMTSDGDIALNAIVQSPDGNISVLADDNVTQAAGGDILVTTAGHIDVEAATGSITMTDGAVASTSGGTILYSADGDVTLGGLTSLMNDVRVQSATGSILDGGATDTEVTAVNALLTAGGTIGSTTDKIDTELTTVAAEAVDGIFLEELAGDLTVGAVNFAGVNQVDMSGNAALTGAAADTGLETTGNGPIVASVASGALTVDEAVAAGGSGNVLLIQRGAGDLTLNSTVSSGTGSIELSSDGEIVQNDDVSTGGAGTIRATTGDAITMADGASSTTAGGGILYGGDAQVTIGSLNAGSGTVVAYSSGDIVDGGETDTDVIAGAAYLEADGGDIGSAADLLETEVSTLAGLATGTGDIYLQNTGAVAIDTVASVNVNQVGMDGVAIVTQTGDASDLAGNDIVLLADDTITVNDGIDGDMVGVDASGAGTILLQTTGAGDVDLNAAVQSGTGNITVLAANNVDLGATGDIATTGGTIDVEATAGAITMAAGSEATSDGGNIGLNAGTDIVLGLLDADTGSVSLTSGGGISAAPGTTLNVRGDELLFDTGLGVGNAGATEFIQTDIATLAGQGGTAGIAINNVGDLEIGAVGDVVVERVDTNGTTSPITSPGFAGMTAAGGNILVTTTDGDITVAEAVDNAGGKVFLAATNGVNNDVLVNNTIVSQTSNVLVLASGDVRVNDDITAASDVVLWADVDGDGTIGSVFQTAGTVEAQSGNMFIAGVNLEQTGVSKLKSANGTMVINVTNNLDFGSILVNSGNAGVETRNLVAGANNIIVDTLIENLLTTVFKAETSVYHSPGNSDGQLTSGSIAIRAGQDIGRDGNPFVDFFRVDGDFLGTFAEGDEFIQEANSVESAGPALLLLPGFEYPSSGPEMAEDVPRPFADTDDVQGLFDGIESAEALKINVPNDLTGTLVIAGNDAVMNVGGNVDLDSIKVGGNLTANVALDFTVETLMANSLDLDVGGNGTVQQFMVDTFANATIGGNFSGGSMTVGGPLNLNVGGDWTYGNVSLGGATDNVTVGGNANVGSLSDQGSLNLDVGGSYAGGSLTVDDTLNATIGNDVDLDSLNVGTLNMTAGGNGTIGSFTVAQNADATFGGNLTGGSMDIGGTTDLKVGGNWEYDTVSFGGDANVMVDGDATVNSLTASQNLIAMVGGNATVADMLVGGNFDGMIGSDFSGTSLGVDGDTLLDVGNNWMYDSATFGGNVEAMVGGNAELTDLMVGGNLDGMIGGDLSGASMTVDGSTLLDVGNNWNYDTATFNGDADVTVGGDATVTDLMASQNLMAMVGNNFMGSTFDASNDAILDVGNDWMYDTVNVGGTLDATVGGQTKVTDFNANTMNLNSGSAQINSLTTQGDSTAVIGGDLTLDNANIGGDADWTTGGNLDVVQLQVNGSLMASVDNTLTFDELVAGSVAIGAGSINLGRLTTGAAQISAGGAINNNGAFINASTLSMTAGGNIGGNSSIPMNVGVIQTVSGGGNVNITQLKPGDTPIGLLRAGGTLVVNVPNGGLVDNNGPDLNIVSGGNSEFNAMYLGTVADALEVEIGESLLIDGAGLTGESPENQARVFINVVGDIAGSARRIQYVGEVSIPGLVFLNGQLLLGDQFLLLEVARTEAFVVETPEIKSPQGVFGDPYFIHLYMQISEAWNLFLDFILFGEAQVNADPEMPPDAKRTIKIGGTEKPYAR